MIKLIYAGISRKKLFCKIEKEEINRKSEFLKSILKIYQCNGCYKAVDIEKLYFRNHEQSIMKLREFSDITDDTEILYIENIIIPCSAAEFNWQNGIIYYFNTSEKNHSKYPHIHVKYQGNKMCIYFETLRVKGHLKNPKKEKEAINYVKSNLEVLYEEWNRIIM